MTFPEIITSALLMGAVGSLHCIGMCGPLALALPVQHCSPTGRLAGGALYNLGRATTYAVLGLGLGLAGEAVFSGKAQQSFSIALGACILLYLLVGLKIRAASALAAAASTPLMKLRQTLAKMFMMKNHASHYLVGVLNGLLPCGLVYLALTSSFLAGGALKGSVFMAFFGLGTFPAMLAVMFFGTYLNQQLRYKLRRVVPVFLFVMGALLILRGLNLGIPFISPMLPGMAKSGAASCH